MIDMTAIAQAVLTLIAALFTTFLIPWIKSKTTQNQYNTIKTVVQHSVQAAEQIYESGQGQQKKQYVLDYLNSKGMTVDDTVIEGTVNSLFGKSGQTSGEFTEVD